MMIKTVKVSDKGQIAIPQKIRDQARIKKGDELIILQDKGRIMIEKPQKISAKVKDEFKDILKFNEQSLKKIWDNKNDEIWNEYMKK